MRRAVGACGMLLLLIPPGLVRAAPQEQAMVVTCTAIECLWDAPGFSLGPYAPVSFTGRCADLAATAPPAEGIFPVTLTIRCLYAPQQSTSTVQWVTVAASGTLFFDGFETPSSRWSAVQSELP